MKNVKKFLEYLEQIQKAESKLKKVLSPTGKYVHNYRGSIIGKLKEAIKTDEKPTDIVCGECIYVASCPAQYNSMGCKQRRRKKQ